MRRFAGLRALAGAMLLGVCAQAAAQATPAVTDLYQEALRSFAEGRNDEASAALARVIENEPLHAGAWLDLALIQCAIGHAAEARRLLAVIEQRFAPPEGIMEVIRDVRAKGCQRWKPRGAGSLSLGRGIEQNVNQGASSGRYTGTRDGLPIEFTLADDFLPKHDQYTLLGAEYLRDLTPNGSIGFAQLQARRNDTLSQYDSASLFTGIESPWQIGRWTVRGTGMLGLTSLGGVLFQRHLQLQARIGPPITLPFAARFHLIGGWSHIDFRTLNSFDSNTSELKGQFSYSGSGLAATVTAGYARDHATGARPGGDRRGAQLALSARAMLGAAVSGELGYVRQNWRSDLAYAPGVIDTARRQLTHVVRAGLTYPVKPGLNLLVEARQVRNNENISLFQYNDRVLQFNWQWTGL